MFVSVGQVLKDGEGMTVGVMPSMVRLESFDEAKRAAVDTWRHIHDPWVAFLSDIGRVNRELGALRVRARDLAVRVDQFPSNMVERRAKVLNAVTDDRGEIEWWLLDHVKDEPACVSVRILLDTDHVRVSVQIFPDPFVEVVQVMFGPLELPPYTGGTGPTVGD
jgi:hypothetical protein